MLTTGLSAASTVAAFVAAFYWWKSAGVEVPGMTYAEPATNPMHMAFRKAALLNRKGASWAAAAALCQAISTALPLVSSGK